MDNNMNEDASLDLARFDDTFETAEAPSREHDEVPDGKYQVIVDRVELTRSQTSGNPMLKWGLKVIAPAHRGRFLWRNNVIGSPENIKWLKQDLITCGLQLTKLSELPANLDKLKGIALEVTKRTRGENTNIYLNKKIQLSAEATMQDGEDLLPF